MSVHDRKDTDRRPDDVLLSLLSEEKRIGLTGTMGAGKSMAAALLAQKIPVIDCDQITASLLEKGKRAYLALEEAGMLFCDSAGNLDKKETANHVFEDPEYKKAYEQILHPMILEELKSWLEHTKGVHAAEVPLLFELHLQDLFDEVWCISADQKIAVERLKNGRGIDEAEALRRWNHQFPAEEKARLSTRVFMNNSTKEDLEDQLDLALKEIAANH